MSYSLARSWAQSSGLTKLIALHSAVWLLLSTLPLFPLCEGTWGNRLMERLSFMPDLYHVERQPYSLLTYCWVHSGLVHLVGNMLFLFFFGSYFLRYHSWRRLLSLYIIGIGSGALLYLVGYQALYLLGYRVPPYPLYGASAGVMAIAFGFAGYVPHLRLDLWRLFEIKAIYFVSGLLALLSLLNWSNVGGHMAHIGGALVGWSFAYLLKERGKDITEPLSLLIDRLMIYCKKHSKNNHKARTGGISQKQYAQQSRELDRILDKIKHSGYNSLDESERKQLTQTNGRD